jgi:acetate kinase
MVTPLAEASTPGSHVKVRVLKTDEELIIARHAVKLLSQDR